MLLRKVFLLPVLALFSTFVQSQLQLPVSPSLIPSLIGNVGPPLFSTQVSSAVPVNRGALEESFRRVSQGAQQFALEMVAKFSDIIMEASRHTGKPSDFMISPFTVWSLLLLLAEGAEGETLKQLRNVLHIDNDQYALRNAFREVQRYLSINTTTIEVASLQAIFTDINQPLARDYENIIERDYSSRLYSVNFHDPATTYEQINDEVKTATRGLIPFAVLPQDLKDVNMFLLSSMYFKGQWKNPFNKSLTRMEPFYDEQGNQNGEVEMMFQELNANYAGMNELEAHVLELPYGKEDRLSMLIILPKKGVSLNKIFHNIEKTGIQAIFDKLTASAVGFEDDVVEVYLPKFTTTVDFALPSVLQQMGISDIFYANSANLRKMGPNLFVSNIIHATKIIVNEEGTIAAGATAATLANKSTPPKFYLNRPFAYLIVEKKTNLLLFAGQLVNPNKK